MSDEKHYFDVFLSILQSQFVDAYEIADLVLKIYHTDLYLSGYRIKECEQTRRLFGDFLTPQELSDEIAAGNVV